LGIMKMQQSMSRKGDCWDNGVPRRRKEGRSPASSYAAWEMRVGPSEPGYRTWLQTTTSCYGQKLWWWALLEKAL